MKFTVEIYKEKDEDGIEYYVAESKELGIIDIGKTPGEAMKEFAIFFEGEMEILENISDSKLSNSMQKVKKKYEEVKDEIQKR